MHKKRSIEIYEHMSKLVDYDETTGTFTWKTRENNTAFNARCAGKKCGTLKDTGYIEINHNHDNKSYRVSAHILVWYFHHKTLPESCIDHLNRNRSDNRITNLRAVSYSENSRNLPLMKNNKSGVTGVIWDVERKKWRAYGYLMSKIVVIGRFDLKEDAITARLEFNKKHGFSENHGT